MPSKSQKTFSGQITEGSIKDIPDINCYRMKNMICLENKFLTRSGYKKIGNDYSNFPIIASGGNLYVGGHSSSSPFSARINMIYDFKRVVGGKFYINYPTLRTGLGTPTGTPITTVTELQAMENDLTGSYYLANNIDASATSGWNSGAGFDPIGTFTGVFDGDGYTITDLSINRTTDYIGLFGNSSGEIKNIGLIDSVIVGLTDVGSIIGINSGTLTNFYSTGTVYGEDREGGAVGLNSGTMTTGYSVCAVSGLNDIGGLVGYDDSGTYNDCFWDTQTSGQATSGGGTGKTTIQMKIQATFINWDFDTIWEML